MAVYLIGVPCIIIWVIGFPFFIFMILRKNKQNLATKDILIKYGLYYVGLTDESYYWEVLIVNFRKVFMITIFVSIGRTQVHLQAMLCFSVLYFHH